MPTIPISMLTVDMDLYPRRFIDRGRVKLYAAAMKQGAKFPQIKTARVEGKTVVLDGVHRIEARKLLGYETIETPIDLGPMARAEAFAEAVRLNAEHGKPLTKIERFQAYKKLVDQGYGIEKVEAILSVKSGEISKWKVGKATQVYTGQEVGKRFDRKVLFWRIREIKSILKNGLNGDEEVYKRLEDLQVNINVYLDEPLKISQIAKELSETLKKVEERHSKTVTQQLMELQDILQGLK